MKRNDDYETLITINLHILPAGARNVSHFKVRQVQLETATTKVQDVKEQHALVSPSSLVLHGGNILPDDITLKSLFFDSDAKLQEQQQNRLQQEQQQENENQHQDANSAAAAAAAGGSGGSFDSSSSLGKTMHHLVIVGCSSKFFETVDWQDNPNTVARLLNAGVVIECALAAASRSMWQRGFPEFFSSAQVLYRMMDASARNTSAYQRRIEAVCMANNQMQAVLPFNEFDGRLMLPPVSMLNQPRQFIGEWACDYSRDGLSRDEIEARDQKAKLIQDVQQDFEKIEPVVVRVFGYHVSAGASTTTTTSASAATSCAGGRSGAGGLGDSLRGSNAFSATAPSTTTTGTSGSSAPTGNQSFIACGGVHVVPFTAFFVSRKLLLTTRTAAYNASTGTFASSFRFTRRLRALHGMLEEMIDLHDLRVVPGVAERLAEQIVRLGISVDPSNIPPGLASTEWCDLLLLEVVDPGQYAAVGEYLLPEINPLPGSKQDNTLFCMSYPAAPSSEWVENCFGSKGYNTSVTEDVVRKCFWGYDLKTTCVGEVIMNQEDLMQRNRCIYHNCSVLPGSRGAPLLRSIKKTVISSHDASKETIYLFAGIERGRSVEELTAQREDIIALSTSEIARRDSLAYNVRNEAHASNHLSIVLLYQSFVAQDVANHLEHRKYLQEFLAPYEIFTSRQLLSTCHRLMLKDADDFNECGVDFYEHKDLQHALHCFREGAKMFSTAMIPNLTEYELELRNALQTNVTSVVVALKFNDSTGGMA